MFHERVDLSLESLSGVLEQADYRVRAGAQAAARVWPTGFEILDANLTGGFRSGELVLIAGPQGLGKTTFAMQVGRNVARSGRAVLVFSYEHDLQTLLIRLVSLEAGLLGSPDAPSLNRVRQTFEAADGLTGSLSERLADTDGGAKALEIVQEYADRFLLHRSTGSSTGLAEIRAALAKAREDTGLAPLVIVDYLQKVHLPGTVYEEEERVTLVVEGLKDMALEEDVPILAVAPMVVVWVNPKMPPALKDWGAVAVIVVVPTAAETAFPTTGQGTVNPLPRPDREVVAPVTTTPVRPVVATDVGAARRSVFLEHGVDHHLPGWRLHQ